MRKIFKVYPMIVILPDYSFFALGKTSAFGVFFVTFDIYSSYSVNGTGMVSCLIDNTNAANTSFNFRKAEGTTAGFAIKKTSQRMT